MIQLNLEARRSLMLGEIEAVILVTPVFQISLPNSLIKRPKKIKESYTCNNVFVKWNVPKIAMVIESPDPTSQQFHIFYRGRHTDNLIINMHEINTNSNM